MVGEARVAGRSARRQDLEGLTDIFLVSLTVGACIMCLELSWVSGALLCVLGLVGFAQYVFGFLVSDHHDVS